MLAIVYVALVAPRMSTPPFCHWYVGAGLPPASTVNVAEAPAVTVTLAGWGVKLGATGPDPAAMTKFSLMFALLPPAPFAPSQAVNVQSVVAATVGVPETVAKYGATTLTGFPPTILIPVGSGVVLLTL